MVNSFKFKKILITGGTSRFFRYLKNELPERSFNCPKKKIFNILKLRQMCNYVKKKKFTHLIHIAGLSRPMKEHDKNIIKSIII